jgi:beta-phosphoglucomutase-like phosphatase (HAD superfamily)
MADGVLLDWEGVLADTRGARRDALRAALAAEGLERCEPLESLYPDHAKYGI